ncbi:unnamed protein product [Lactuca saligna]|uniref:Uncharacterized protein n=1 Tax=Lactuca saligna TaxID=75948 RepID=A0AA35Z2U2_LACSI|nr:unnamed protein product [Lactuca saligna]
MILVYSDNHFSTKNDNQDPKQLQQPHTSHAFALSQVMLNNLNCGPFLTPLELSEPNWELISDAINSTLQFKVKLMEERNMKPLDSNLAALSARCSKDLKLNLAKSFLSEMGQSTTPYPYNRLLGAVVLKNYEKQDATLISWNLMYRVD